MYRETNYLGPLKVSFVEVYYWGECEWAPF